MSCSMNLSFLFLCKSLFAQPHVQFEHAYIGHSPMFVSFYPTFYVSHIASAIVPSPLPSMPCFMSSYNPSLALV